ncbi:MAG: tRNA (adenosine(37)-N6)-threonylcarbamoyltransferase complex transferase subunit TsaD [Deltaproteobacteria bacterium]|nr:tRNA (adenosine(37)-N6)-threonylcarbamoyltransferase complex transferase subunit TsaD [Deltaproteobacteria bacterium]
MLILGIETSCDETAAAVIKDGNKILSSVISSQVEIHHQFGGVVPELASRSHNEQIIPVVNKAIKKAKIKIDDINAVAATRGPGLIGSLLVGFSFAKAFSFAKNIPCAGVDHLCGHICSIFLEKNPPKFPFVSLLASGGHTNIYYVESPLKYTLIGRTRDDAAGEAYDKVSKMLGFGYPGGKIIDDLAKKGDPLKINFPKPYLDKELFDFSFSGLKTAVLRYIQTHKNEYKQEIVNIAASFQNSATDVLSYKIINAAIVKNTKNIVIVGGVAANEGLRKKVIEKAKKKKLNAYFPSYNLCGDNGAMIAAAGYYYIKEGRFIKPEDDVYSRIRTN